MNTPSAAPVATSLSFLYNPPGMAPGKGAREVTAWFTRDPKGGVKFDGAVSSIESLARDIVPYRGKTYLYATSLDVPKNAAAVAELTDAYTAALPQISAGKKFEFNKNERTYANGYPNKRWELVTINKDAFDTKSGTIFTGRFDNTENSAPIEKLEETLLKFGKFMRKL